MEKQFKIVGNDISDGYHTFDELYEHRCILYLAFVKSWADSTPNSRLDTYLCPEHYEGWDCLTIRLRGKLISYHIKSELNHLYTFPYTLLSKNQQEAMYDGHSSEDVLARLEKFTKST